MSLKDNVIENVYLFGWKMTTLLLKGNDNVYKYLFGKEWLKGPWKTMLAKIITCSVEKWLNFPWKTMLA